MDFEGFVNSVTLEYTISNASENGSNQTYTLNNNLINQVKKGDIVQVTQDLVKVL